MSINSGVAWCHDTANLWWGCVEVAPECDNCYAREWAARFDRAKWGVHEPRVMMPGVWKSLAKMQRLAVETGETRRVFVGSMMDIAEKEQPVINAAGESQFMADELLEEASARLATPITRREINHVAHRLVGQRVLRIVRGGGQKGPAVWTMAKKDRWTSDPGTPERVAEMTARAERGLPATIDPDDADVDLD